jgi:plastocyanin
VDRGDVWLAREWGGLRLPTGEGRGGLGGIVLALMALLLLLAGCGSAASNEVDMGVASFRQSQITIKAGQAVHFVDPASGGTHVICVGHDLECVPQAGAPAALNTPEGLTFNTGDIRDIVFPTPGTYNVICTIHPNMQTVVTVQ